MIWFGLVLWHINNCWSFNARFFLCVYIKYIWFDMVWFYGISTIVGHLMPDTFYAYILNIYDLIWFGLVLWHINNCWSFNPKSFFFTYILDIWVIFLNEPELIFFHTVKWFHLFISNTNTQLNLKPVLF